VHVHIRDAEAAPTLDPVRLKDTVAALREATDARRAAVHRRLGARPARGAAPVLDAEPDSCSLTCGTVNFGPTSS
jgi:3-keto-5-aminohexanoate cleavage enzyme